MKRMMEFAFFTTMLWLRFPKIGLSPRCPFQKKIHLCQSWPSGHPLRPRAKTMYDFSKALSHLVALISASVSVSLKSMFSWYAPLIRSTRASRCEGGVGAVISSDTGTGYNTGVGIRLIWFPSHGMVTGSTGRVAAHASLMTPQISCLLRSQR